MGKKASQKTVEIVGILDRSGSMARLIDETITGYNAFIREQREEGPAKVTLAIFDDRYDVLYSGIDIEDVPELTRRVFYERGMTALRDAIGRTITTVHGNQKNGERPDKTLVFIVTDGYENASKEYTHDAIKKLVKKRTKKGWEFFFIGADIDAFSQGHAVGIAKKNIVKTPKTKQAIAQSYAAASNTANRYRSGASMNDSYSMEDMYIDSAKDAERFMDKKKRSEPSGTESDRSETSTTDSWMDRPAYESEEG